MQNLLIAHDTLSQQALQPVEDMDGQGEPLDYPLVQYGEDTVKIIHLEKTGEHLVRMCDSVWFEFWIVLILITLSK